MRKILLDFKNPKALDGYNLSTTAGERHRAIEYSWWDYIGEKLHSLIDATNLVIVDLDKGGFMKAESQMEKVPYNRIEIKDVSENSRKN